MSRAIDGLNPLHPHPSAYSAYSACSHWAASTPCVHSGQRQALIQHAVGLAVPRKPATHLGATRHALAALAAAAALTACGGGGGGGGGEAATPQPSVASATPATPAPVAPTPAAPAIPVAPTPAQPVQPAHPTPANPAPANPAPANPAPANPAPANPAPANPAPANPAPANPAPANPAPANPVTPAPVVPTPPNPVVPTPDPQPPSPQPDPAPAQPVQPAHPQPPDTAPPEATQPDPAQPVDPPPPPSRHPHPDRIEPLDTRQTGKVAAVVEHQAIAVVSRLPAGAGKAQVTLSAPAQNKASAAVQDGPLQVGFGRAVTRTADNIAPLLRWHLLADGAQVAALTFTSQGAHAIRVPAIVHALPAGAVLRWLPQGAGQQPVQYSGADVARQQARNRAAGLTGEEAQTIWGPFFDGSSVTLEIELPAAARHPANDGDLHIAVPSLQHLHESVTATGADLSKNTGTLVTNDVGRAGACHLDAMCNAPEAQRRAVAKIMFTRSDGSFKCSGTLMNNTRDDLTPYFATAWHCVGNAQAAASLESYWFLHSRVCGEPTTVNPDYVRVPDGADMVYTNEFYDFTLLKLRRPAPEAAVFSGSYIGPNDLDAPIHGIHHPRGDLQKYSEGKVTGYANCTVSRQGRASCVSGAYITQADSRHLLVRWIRGVTEGGSSGSGLLRSFDGKSYLAGVLTAGSARCEAPYIEEQYGRFDQVYARGRLHRYLRPE